MVLKSFSYVFTPLSMFIVVYYYMSLQKHDTLVIALVFILSRKKMNTLTYLDKPCCIWDAIGTESFLHTDSGLT